MVLELLSSVFREGRVWANERSQETQAGWVCLEQGLMRRESLSGGVCCCGRFLLQEDLGIGARGA